MKTGKDNESFEETVNNRQVWGGELKKYFGFTYVEFAALWGIQFQHLRWTEVCSHRIRR